MEVSSGITYRNCGGAWYQQFAGTQPTCVVVNAPK